MSGQHIVLSERTRSGDQTGAGILRNQCAFTSRDMGAGWPEAFTYAIVFGWDDEDGVDESAYPELVERFGYDDDLIAFLRDAHERFKALPDKREVPDA